MTSTYEENRRKLNASRFRDPNRFQNQLNTIKKVVNPEDPTFISELFLDLKTGYSAFKSTPGGPYIKSGSAVGAVGLRRLIKQADVPEKIVNIFKGNTGRMLNPPPVSKVKPSNLNVLGDFNPVVKSSSKSTILDDLNLNDAFGTKSLTQQGLSYQRRVFNISKTPISEVQNTFIQDLSQLSGQSIESVTQKYNKILATQIRGKRTFVGTQDQYSRVKAYFQSLHDLKITKRKSAYVVIDTVDGPKKYFADPKVSGGSRINPVSLDAKLDRQKIAGVNRWKRILNQTVHKKDIGNWHTKMAKQLGDEAHHLNELHLVAVMTDGRSADSIASVIKQINKEMIFTGNSTFNKINLPKSVHKQIHGKMREVFADYKNIDFTKMSNKELVNFFKTDYKVKMNEINETIFSEMMKSKHGKYKPK